MEWLIPISLINLQVKIQYIAAITKGIFIPTSEYDATGPAGEFGSLAIPCN